MISDARQATFDRVNEFTRLKRRELLAEGFEVNGIFDIPNFDQGGNIICGVDTMVIGFGIAKDGKSFIRFFGNTSLLFWDEIGPLLDYEAVEDLPDAEMETTTVSKKVEGACVHIDGEKSPAHYKAILDVAKGLKLQGLIDYDRLKDAARRYILSVQHKCLAKGLKIPRINTISLMR